MLRRKDAIDDHEAEHGEEEHAEGHEALLAVLELKGTDTQAFDDAVEELAKVVNHHLTEEELTILNPAREEVGERVRAELASSSRPPATATSTTTAVDWPTSAGSSGTPRRRGSRRRVTAVRILGCGAARMRNTVGLCRLPPSPGPRSSGPPPPRPLSSA